MTIIGPSGAFIGKYRGRARSNAETGAQMDAKLVKRGGAVVRLCGKLATSHRFLISVEAIAR
jgi:hypothetical protein